MSSQRRSSDIAREQFRKFNFESKGKGFSDRASHPTRATVYFSFLCAQPLPSAVLHCLAATRSMAGL
jgi:hypothetical protein